MELCPDQQINDNKPLLFLSFDLGSETYSNKTPAYFNFTTTYIQSFGSIAGEKVFSFINIVPENSNAWHTGALDHTENDTNGYMMLINFGSDREDILNMTVSNLCVGSYYLFSVYMANIVRQLNISEPQVMLEVGNRTVGNESLTKCSTQAISEYESMTWTKYSLPFRASSTSIILLITSYFGAPYGDDLAIDDIELRACSTVHCGLCPPG